MFDTYHGSACPLIPHYFSTSTPQGLNLLTFCFSRVEFSLSPPYCYNLESSLSCLCNFVQYKFCFDTLHFRLKLSHRDTFLAWLGSYAILGPAFHLDTLLTVLELWQPALCCPHACTLPLPPSGPDSPTYVPLQAEILSTLSGLWLPPLGYPSEGPPS